MEAALGLGTGKPGKIVIADVGDIAMLPWVAGARIVYRQRVRTGYPGRMLPQAYGYPAEKRATRDLLRRHFMRERAQLFAHIQNTHSQYNLPEIGKKIAYKTHRDGVAERFAEPSVHKSIEMDLALIDHYGRLLTELEPYITNSFFLYPLTCPPLGPSGSPGSPGPTPTAATPGPWSIQAARGSTPG
jgi:hypothetical protein